MKQLLFLSLIIFSFIQPAQSEDAGTKAPAPTATSTSKENERADNSTKLKTGVIASYGKFAGGKSLDALSDSPEMGDDVSPIASNIKRINSNTCIVTIHNNSEKDSYKIAYDVQGLDGKSKVKFQRYYSATLAPGKTTENRVTCHKSLNMQIVLKSGNKI